VARLSRAVATLALVSASALTLAGCGTADAVGQARQACTYVHQALVLDQQSQAPGLTSAERSALTQRAISTLLAGTKYAAAATSADGSWNALMTQINEAERVPLSELAPSLTRLCAVANSSTPYL
jgi:hypothetical protein